MRGCARCSLWSGGHAADGSTISYNGQGWFCWCSAWAGVGGSWSSSRRSLFGIWSTERHNDETAPDFRHLPFFRKSGIEEKEMLLPPPSHTKRETCRGGTRVGKQTPPPSAAAQFLHTRWKCMHVPRTSYPVFGSCNCGIAKEGKQRKTRGASDTGPPPCSLMAEHLHEREAV